MTPRSCAFGSDGVGSISGFAEADLALLAEAGRCLCGPLDLSGVLSRATTLIVPALADWCVLALKQGDGHVRAVAFEHADADCRAELARLAGTIEFDEPRLAVMGVSSWSMPAYGRLETGSVICASLEHANVPLGALLVARKEQAAYPPQTVEVVAEIAQRVSASVGNAMRFETLQADRQQLNEALAVAAHELRAPTAALKTSAQLLVRQFARDEVVSPAELMDALSRMNWQAARLGKMIDRLMDSAVATNGKLSLLREEIDLRELVGNVLSVIHASEPDRCVKVDAPEPVSAEVDALRIEEVLLNLVDNALKFSPKESIVEVSLCVPQPHKALIAVRDHGMGVPTELRQHIFDRFVQAHRAGGGLGLGLYLSQQIVEKHGGTLSAQYPEDGGTRFIVELPALETFLSTKMNSDNAHGGLAHDAARTQADWSARSHSRPPASHIRTAWLNRTAGVSCGVTTSVST